MFLSLLDNNQGEKICIHLLANGLTDAEQQLVQQCVRKKGAQISLYNISDQLFESFSLGNVEGHISKTTFARLFLPSILPLNIERILYLDCDIIITDNLLSLWQYDLGNNEIGAVEDDASGIATQYERLHLPLSHIYFNAGVLLIDLNRWRARGFQQLAVDYLNQNGRDLRYADQDVLNVLCCGRCCYLPFRYNVYESLLREEVPRIRKEALKEIPQALESPAIIHFTYIWKPWVYHSFHPYKKLYYYYLDQTKWRGERPRATWKGWLFRVAWRGAALLHCVNRYLPISHSLKEKFKQAGI